MLKYFKPLEQKLKTVRQFDGTLEKTLSIKNVYIVYFKTASDFAVLIYIENCKFGKFREGFIFAKLAKFRESKNLVKW